MSIQFNLKKTIHKIVTHIKIGFKFRNDWCDWQFATYIASLLQDGKKH